MFGFLVTLFKIPWNVATPALVTVLAALAYAAGAVYPRVHSSQKFIEACRFSALGENEVLHNAAGKLAGARRDSHSEFILF